MPGWTDLNEDNVNRQIEFSNKAKKRSENDLKTITEIIKKGCQNCRYRSEQCYQNLQPAQPEPQPEQTYHQQVDFASRGFIPLL